jgi:hypothetical protein
MALVAAIMATAGNGEWAAGSTPESDLGPISYVPAQRAWGVRAR